MGLVWHYIGALFDGTILWLTFTRFVCSFVCSFVRFFVFFVRSFVFSFFEPFVLAWVGRDVCVVFHAMT